MDKNAIKKYAVWARNELIARVTQKAEQYEITEKKATPKDAESINGRLLTETEKNQRKALIEKIQTDGFEQVMEEVAYTWFNRFTALRFMEVNNYLPSHTRVFTNEAGEFKPQILADAIQLDLEGLDMDKVFELKDANKTEELYKYLLITQCNALSAVLPRMFQKIEHYTELLLPDYLLREGSVIEQMITLIPEEDWTDQVQIIGWLYQYYNSEPKDAVFAALKKNVKISKENIPAATQLFTPDWIVRYMVENSLGRLWLEGHPNDVLKTEWKYYLDETVQEADVQKQLEAIRKEYANLKPEDIRCIDPCMGSGHILCYMFDVLVKIYEDYGYTAREAAENIVEKNLWGLDIDERAAQLSYFAVMMKARQYDRRFLTRGIQPHVYAIEESNGITSAPMHDMGIELSQEEYGKAAKEAMRLVEEMHDAKEYGSIIQVTPCDWELLRRFAIPRGHGEGQMRMDIHGEIEASDRLQVLINIGQALSQKYHAVITNPPYMANGGFGVKLDSYIKKNYIEAKSDLYAVFIKQCNSMTMKNCYQAMITQHSWMFISSYEKLRLQMYSTDIVNMAHLGPRAFEEIAGEVVQTTTFVMRKTHIPEYKGKYERLVEYGSQSQKEEQFIAKQDEYVSAKKNFALFPGNPIVYWVGEHIANCFTNYPMLDEKYTFREGIHTADNNRFLRVWFEVPFDKLVFDAASEEDIDKKGRWVPYNKGGKFRKWYGNNEYVIGFDSVYRGQMSQLKGHVRPSQDLYYKSGGTWTAVASGKLGIRYYPNGYLFDAGGQVVVGNDIVDCIALLNTKIYNFFADMLMPTLNYKCGMLKTLPNLIIKDDPDIRTMASENIRLAKEDWDSFETSWDFKRHPLIQKGVTTVAEAFDNWKEKASARFSRVMENEVAINDKYLKRYHLEDEILSEYDASDITIYKADLERDIKSLISYAVGCMFGRYSLDEEGIVYAGGKWDETRYISYKPDKDGIIPICDDEYFEDDIVGRFVRFIEVVYGKETLEENLKFLADALNGKGASRDVLRQYFINNFYSDHCSTYSATGSGKRPIYWLFDSGKKNGFKCLVYMHRYRTDTIARIRTDYVHEQQSRYRTAISDLEQRISNASTSESVRLNKQLLALQAQSTEIREYEEKIHHLADKMVSIDLDDGFKVNYEKFKDVIARV